MPDASGRIPPVRITAELPWQKVVTPVQLRDGYWRMAGGQQIRCEYKIVRRLPSGDYLVEAPS